MSNELEGKRIAFLSANTGVAGRTDPTVQGTSVTAARFKLRIERLGAIVIRPQTAIRGACSPDHWQVLVSRTCGVRRTDIERT